MLIILIISQLKQKFRDADNLCFFFNFQLIFWEFVAVNETNTNEYTFIYMDFPLNDGVMYKLWYTLCMWYSFL